MTDYTDSQAPRRIRFDPTRSRGREIYAQADRHSRLVRRLKFILPAFAAAGIVVFFLTMRFVSGSGEAVISLAGINVESKSLEMKAPHISGFSGTQQSYEIQATRALQDLNNPKIVKLENIDARFGVGNNQTAKLRAATGVFDGTVNVLKLGDGIELATTDGYTAKLVDAQIDIGKGSLVTARPLQINATNGSIKANGVQVSDRGAHIVFLNGVSVSFTPPADSGDADKPDDAALKDAKEQAAARIRAATE